MAAAGLDTAAALRERQRLAAREDVEEELFVSDGGGGASFGAVAWLG